MTVAIDGGEAVDIRQGDLGNRFTSVDNRTEPSLTELNAAYIIIIIIIKITPQITMTFYDCKDVLFLRDLVVVYVIVDVISLTLRVHTC